MAGALQGVRNDHDTEGLLIHNQVAYSHEHANSRMLETRYSRESGHSKVLEKKNQKKISFQKVQLTIFHLRSKFPQLLSLSPTINNSAAAETARSLSGKSPRQNDPDVLDSDRSGTPREGLYKRGSIAIHAKGPKAAVARAHYWFNLSSEVRKNNIYDYLSSTQRYYLLGMVCDAIGIRQKILRNKKSQRKNRTPRKK
jgi:hypothetical protein